ncbi:lysoplasmalogenase [Aurantibacter sp.]|uniref:lysoplasmalogenase n=1 Tax=Aurantibacter sp. TaxID=2807103 RepID=UPI0035C84F60
MGLKYFIALIIIAVGSYIYASNKALTTLAIILKPLATLLVILIPLIYSKTQTKYKTHIIFGLIFCLIGDVLLLFNSMFIFGLIAFLIGHLIFIKGFILKEGFLVNYKSLAILILYACGFFWFIKNDLGDLLIPVIFYMTCILLMAWQGINLFLSKSDYFSKLIIIAVCLFVLSDTILAINKFKNTLPFANELIGITYWSAITLIGLSTTHFTHRNARNRT